MTVDAILYNGERDIFDIRYNILKDKVDKFIVCEFAETFSGKAKQSHPIVLPNVEYHFISEWTDHSPDIHPNFIQEYNQREAIKDTLLNLKDDDIVIISDCDEIPGSNKQVDFIKPPIKLRLRVYTYWLNNASDEPFNLGPIVAEYKDIKNASINDLRSNLPLTDSFQGWHFTNMGGVDFIKNKIEAYSHQEFNNDAVKDSLQYRLQNNEDYVGRGYRHWIDESEWPQYLKDNKDKYKHLCK